MQITRILTAGVIFGHHWEFARKFTFSSKVQLVYKGSKPCEHICFIPVKYASTCSTEAFKSKQGEISCMCTSVDDMVDKGVIKSGIDKTVKRVIPKNDHGKDKSVATVWATLPPIDPKEDIAAAYAEAAKIAKESNVYIGAHISAAGGPENSVKNAYNITGQSFALFLKNQRRWDFSKIPEKNVKAFKKALEERGYDPKYILPHGSFLINMANPDASKRKKAYANFLDDLERCEALGIPLFNFHPGSTVGQCDKSESIKHVAKCINDAIEKTTFVKIVLENAAGQRNVVGSDFEDLRDILNLVKKKERVGVCLDTCHLFAAGYDIRTWDKFEAVMRTFDSVVGLEYLCAVHLNDCKSTLGSGLDRHENIGKGHLTLETFQFIVNSGYFCNMPIILETPDVAGDEKIYRREVKYCYSLYDAKKAEESIKRREKEENDK